MLATDFDLEMVENDFFNKISTFLMILKGVGSMEVFQLISMGVCILSMEVCTFSMEVIQMVLKGG